MALLAALFLALATLSPAAALADIAAACSDPSDIPTTKVQLLSVGWMPVSPHRQERLEREFASARDPSDNLKVAFNAFGNKNAPDALLIVSDEREADGFWTRSCALRDPKREIVNDLETVKAGLSLQGLEAEGDGPDYSWELGETKKTFELFLPSQPSDQSVLIIQKYGRD